jgi:hypothetical protein
MLKFSQFISEEIEAWHGSPHSFNEFSRKNTAHTGEGGAAYGSGIYVSSHREVGEHYRDMKGGGKLYKLKVTSDPKKMMHWHKKVSDQSSHVQKALKKVAPDFDWDNKPDPEARHVFHHLRKVSQDGGANRIESSESASNTLNRAGIHGVSYHGDIEGKAKTKPTNHVIFNPKHIKIEKKYDDKGEESKD